MEAVKHMQCMEVWGGNRSVDSGVIMPGMDSPYGRMGGVVDPHGALFWVCQIAEGGATGSGV